MADQLSFASFIDTTPRIAKSKPLPKKDIEKIYSVSEFIDHINNIVKPIECIVQGEISQVTERGTAVYFTLSDKKEKAALSCIVWRAKLNSFGITLKEGLEVKIVGAANIYKPTGRFSLMANYITPVGEGALKQAFEQLKRKLQLEGYFDTARKRSVPQYVQSLGLVTSDMADAKKDFLTHLGNFGIKIYFYDVRVEGVKSVDSIVNALRWFNENAADVEVLVLTRGGGSLESLQSFNSEPVAKAIYSSRIPIISAVGHENDVTIADLVADLRASTPTDAGKILSEHWNQALIKVDEIDISISAIFRKICNDLTNRLENIQQNIIFGFKRTLERESDKIVSIDRSLSASFQKILRDFKYITDRFTYNFNQFTNKWIDSKKRIDEYEKYLFDFSSRWYKSLNKYIDIHERTLSASDPDLKLKQGYSIAFDKNRKVIKSVDMVAITDTVTIKLHTGEIIATVDKTL